MEPIVVSYQFEDDQSNAERGLDLDLDVGAIDFGDIGGCGDDVQLETGQHSGFNLTFLF